MYANQRWSSGALVETAKNGTPIATASSASVPNIGNEVLCGASDFTMGIGEWL